MRTATIHQAKTNLSRLIEQAQQGEEIIISRGKTPVARLVPIDPAPKRRHLGIFAGMMDVGDEINDPLPEDELRLWNCEDSEEE